MPSISRIGQELQGRGFQWFSERLEGYKKTFKKKQFFIEIFKGQKVMNSPGFPSSIHGVQKKNKKNIRFLDVLGWCLPFGMVDTKYAWAEELLRQCFFKNS